MKQIDKEDISNRPNRETFQVGDFANKEKQQLIVIECN